MFVAPDFREKLVYDTSQKTNPEALARRSNRRRLTVFLIIFLATLVPGLIWNLLRPAEYRANARVQITTGTVTARIDAKDSVSNAGEPAGQKNDLLTQAQILTSRSLLEEVLHRLEKEGLATGIAGADPINALQSSITASQVPGTDIVEIQAIGASPQLMARIVNTLIESYRDQLLTRHDSDSQLAISNLRDEIAKLGENIAEKRAHLNTFRARSGVVSSERSENETLAYIKGLSESANKANEDAAKAEARLRALRESAASGKSPVNAKDNPTLAAIEQRISTTREQLRNMERTYTPDFMAMDPTARTLRASLTELERQLTSTRLSSQQAAMADAEEQASGARATVERLRGQIANKRHEAQLFSGSFHEAQAMEEDLVRLEGTRRNANERLAKLESSESTRLPVMTLIEAAAVPQTPWRPEYVRDGLTNLAVSFLLGLLSVWFVELFNRSSVPPAETTIVVPQPWMGSAPALETPSMRQALPHQQFRQALPQPGPAASLPKELTQDEVAALLAGADRDGRQLCAILLLGLTADEVKELAFSDLDLKSLRLTVRGASARTLPLPNWLALALARDSAGDPDRPLFCDSLGKPLSASDIGARVTCVALDSGIDDATYVTPEALRHTYIDNLMRQKVRFSDLAAFAGKLSAEEIAAYAALYTGPRQAQGTEIDPIMPAVRNAETG